MKLFSNLSRLQLGIFVLLIAGSAALGYLYYDTYKTNIQDREIIKQTRTQNLDLSQDLKIIKDKYDKLKTEVDVLKVKVAKVSYKKKNYKKKRISSAGKSSKYKKNYKRSKVNYKKLYLQLKKKCATKHKSSGKKYKSKSKYKPISKKYKSPNRNYRSTTSNNSNYKPPTSREYKRN